jgi:hypothetical protein
MYGSLVRRQVRGVIQKNATAEQPDLATCFRKIEHRPNKTNKPGHFVARVARSPVRNG